MRILYFNTGFGLGTAKSGGDTRFIEIAKALQESGDEIEVVMTKGARLAYEQSNFHPTLHEVKAGLFFSRERNRANRVASYIVSLFSALWRIRSLGDADIVYSTSDSFCDVIPAWYFRRCHPKSRWVSMIHHACKPWWRRKGNWAVNVVSYYGQRLSFWFIKRADGILVYDTPEGAVIGREFVARGVDGEKIHPVWNGVPLTQIEAAVPASVHYAACFAGGLRATKGIYDLIRIWSQVVKTHPDAVVAVAGGGHESVVADLKEKIRIAGIEGNIKLLGPLPSSELYGVMKSSRVFISASREEGWGIAVCEALACRIPVVAYRLPAFTFLEKHITQIDGFDDRAFASALNTCLQSESTRSEELQALLRRLDWYNIAHAERTLFTRARSE